jgi:SAM-dependent methyltransferase
MNATELLEIAELKRGARLAWAAGDFPTIAQDQLWPVGARIVDLVDVRPGEDVLDVACGTGNAALRAAQAGGRVVGVDLTPELFDAGRRLAAEAGVQIEWVQGDAEDLPMPDAGFDVVLSTFGCMFAPRHAVTAGELARVLRPGGRMGLCSWTPEGSMGAFFAKIGSYLPPPSPLAEPPVLWGSEPHVEALFEGTGIELTFERDVVQPLRFESTQAALEYTTTKFGPLIMARRIAEASGRWPELRRELEGFHERGEPGEYLIVVGRKPDVP